MRRLSCKIEIWRNWTTEEGAKLSRRWTVERVAGVKITGDTSSLQDTCVVSLARNTKWEGEPRIPVRRGDEVKVWLGYDGKLKLRFIGQVQEVSAKTPTTLTCIDGMMKLQHREFRLKVISKTQGLKQRLLHFVTKSMHSSSINIIKTSRIPRGFLITIYQFPIIF